jgi:Prenyltransferase and squalene oxidase repeat
MWGRLGIASTAVFVAGLPWIARAGEPELSPASVRVAAAKALPLIEKSTAEYPHLRDCFSCHHQAVPVFALSLSRDRGFWIDDENLQEQVELTLSDLGTAIESYRKGNGQPGGVTRAGYALWTLANGGSKPDETTAAVVDFLLKRDADRDHWRESSKRPPSEASPFTSTFVALRALKIFGTANQRERIDQRTAKAREWLLQASAADTEDRVFRLWSLKLADAPDSAIRDAAAQLLGTQREDGGWAQLADGSSDAYATGTALVALHEAAGLDTKDAAYQRGLAFLIKTQLDDGSWYVKSRSKPFQTYFESGFPHAKDQFISMAASSWATAALVLACPKE